MPPAPIVVVASSDRRPPLVDAFDDVHEPPDVRAAVATIRNDPVSAVVCDAAGVDWKAVAASAADRTPSVPAFVLTTGSPTPDRIAETGAKPVYVGDDWDWVTAVASQVADAARDYRVRVEHDHSQEYHDQLLENAPVPIVVVGPDRHVRRANEASAGLFGYDSPDAIEGRPVTDFVVDDQTATEERLERVIEDRVAVPPMTLDVLDADGNPVQVLSATSPTVIDGEPAAQAIIPPDEPYRTRRELVRSKEKIESIHAVAVELEAVESQRAVCERTIAAAEEILEFDICVVDSVRDGYFHVEASSENLPDENVAQSRADEGILGMAYQRGETIITDDISAVEAADPQGPYASALSIPLGEWGGFQAASTEPGAFDEDDAELAEILMSHAHVAVERIEREQELRERERAFSTLHDATREMAQAETRNAVLDRAVAAARDTLDLQLTGAFVHDPDARCLRPVALTPEARDVFEAPPELHEGESLAYDVFAEGEPAVYDDLAREEGLSNPDTVIRSEMILPLGEYGVLLVGDTSPNAFDAVDASTARVLASNTTTVLERVQREVELREERERLDEFASVVAHDLQNPLNHASGFIELARETGDDEYLRRAESNVAKMSRLVSDVLTLSRQGDVIGSRETVELAAAANDAWRPVAGADATLVPPDDGVTVVADRDRLVELLRNLFENARTHVGPDVTVRVAGSSDGFFVEDDGPGIPADRRSEVFEHGYSTSADGTGFGLSIVERIADAHDWTVSVTDGTDGGARFEFAAVSTPSDNALPTDS